jgi:nitroreductase
MEVTDAIHMWRSIRKYKSQSIPDETLRKILEAGRRAPSWCNVQPWHFIVIEDPSIKQKLSELAGGQKQVALAPVVIGVCGDLSAWDKPKHREALIELVHSGVINAPEEVIDNVLLKDQLIYVAGHGPSIILSRTFEQLGIAYAFMAIEAINQGLGMCIVGAFGNEITQAQKERYGEIKASLGIPEKMYLLCMLTLGVPDEEPKPRPRKLFDNIVSRGTVGHKF